MPTIIDKLVVAIGLDKSDFKKGEASARDDIDRLKGDLKSRGAQAETEYKKHGDALRKLALDAAKFYAVLSGSAAVKNFISQVTQADAALGRTAGRLGQAPQDLAAFGLAAERSGGSSSAAIASFESYSNAIQDWKNTGSTGLVEPLARLSAAGGVMIDMLAPIPKQFLQISENIQNVAKTDPVKASWLGSLDGRIDPDTVSMLMQGPQKVQELLKTVKQFGPGGADVSAAQQYRAALTALSQAATSVKRSVVTALSPAITEIIERFNRWLAANKEWLSSEISARVKAFADDIAKIDWQGVRAGMTAFIEDAKSLAEKLGGAKGVAIILFGLFAGVALASLVSAFSLLRMALIGVGIGVASGALAANAANVLAVGQYVDLRGYRGRGAMPARGGGAARQGVYARGRRAEQRRAGGAGVGAAPVGNQDFSQNFQEGEGLSVKPGAGTGHEGTLAFARIMQGEGLVNRVTAFRDQHHAKNAPRSLHNRGLAGDYTLKNPANSEAALARMRQIMRAAGLSDSDVELKDEYKHPSRGATAPHMHFAFKSEAAAARLAAYAATLRTAKKTKRASAPNTPNIFGGAPNLGAFVPPGGGVMLNPNMPGRPQINEKHTSIQHITVHSQATDAPGIARDIRKHIQQQLNTALA